ncbi:DUF2057 family protein [Gallaecimonas mangrovi]|uniref:DUF2057 family protein n=1 Tax=Gallaecimonas mangrovi TaxID=2291597 RepID=UPI000E1FF7C7|nr:DUF2057 family protein [Gallaecimonas mangrovi]
MRFKSLLALSVFALSAHAAEVKLADAVYVYQADNTEFKNYLWHKTDHITLSPGKHQLKVSYSWIFPDGFESNTKVETDPHWITIDIPTDGNYLLTTPKLIDVDAAKKWRENPHYLLETIKGHQLAALTPRPDAPPKQLPSDPVKAQNMAEQQLKYWWSQADADTRQRFEQWLKSQH